MKMWDPVVVRSGKRLVGWNRNILSKGEKLTLIKNTSANLLIYYMSLLIILVGVAKRAESMSCRFLCGNSNDKKNHHLVAWDEIKKLMSHSGSGLRAIVEMYLILQDKWL